MIIELACIGGYYLLCDYLNPHNQKRRSKERAIRSMKGDIMSEIEKRLKGLNITAGGNVNININIQVNNYDNCTINKLTFNESPLHLNDYTNSFLFKKQENLYDNALKFSQEQITLESLRERKLLPSFERDDPLEKYRTPMMRDILKKLK